MLPEINTALPSLVPLCIPTERLASTSVHLRRHRRRVPGFPVSDITVMDSMGCAVVEKQACTLELADFCIWWEICEIGVPWTLNATLKRVWSAVGRSVGRSGGNGTRTGGKGGEGATLIRNNDTRQRNC